MTTINSRPNPRRPLAVPAAKAASSVQAAPQPSRPIVGTPGVDQLVMKNATSQNSVALHLSPTESHDALLKSIKEAKKSFYIETFIWHNDEAGREIADALIAKVKAAKAKGESFDAKVLIDYLGLRNASGGSNDLAIVDYLRKGGVEVLEFGKGYLDLKADYKITPITHRKLYIQDGTQFTTGGRNIGNEYLNPTYQLADGKSEASWHDLLYTVKGNETGRILDEFFINWQRAGGTKPAQMPVVVPNASGTAKVESVLTNPHTGFRGIREAHSKAIANAKSEIVAIYPYFSDDQLVKELIAAKKKNPALSIKIMMPANKEASHEGSIYSILNKQTARQFLEAGIEVRMFDGGDVQRFSHMKAMTFDGKLLSLGSANGDARTYNANHELNTLISDPATAKAFRSTIFDKDWAVAKPITKAELDGASWWERLKGKVLEMFDFLL